MPTDNFAVMRLKLRQGVYERNAARGSRTFIFDIMSVSHSYGRLIEDVDLQVWALSVCLDVQPDRNMA
jgi:hypothetical protein